MFFDEIMLLHFSTNQVPSALPYIDLACLTTPLITVCNCDVFRHNQFVTDYAIILLLVP